MASANRSSDKLPCQWLAEVSPTESPSAESARVACTSCVSAGLASLFYINALLSTTVPSGHAGASSPKFWLSLSQFRTQEHHVACVDCRLDGRSAIGIEAAPTTSNHSAGKCEIRSSDRVLAARARDRWHGKGDAGMAASARWALIKSLLVYALELRPAASHPLLQAVDKSLDRVRALVSVADARACARCCRRRRHTSMESRGRWATRTAIPVADVDGYRSESSRVGCCKLAPGTARDDARRRRAMETPCPMAYNFNCADLSSSLRARYKYS